MADSQITVPQSLTGQPSISCAEGSPLCAPPVRCLPACPKQLVGVVRCAPAGPPAGPRCGLPGHPLRIPHVRATPPPGPTSAGPGLPSPVPRDVAKLLLTLACLCPCLCTCRSLFEPRALRLQGKVGSGRERGPRETCHAMACPFALCSLLSSRIRRAGISFSQIRRRTKQPGSRASSTCGEGSGLASNSMPSPAVRRCSPPSPFLLGSAHMGRSACCSLPGAVGASPPLQTSSAVEKLHALQQSNPVCRAACVVWCRDIPLSIHPFSKGILRNLYLAFCLPEYVLPVYVVPSMSRLSRTAWSSLTS